MPAWTRLVRGRRSRVVAEGASRGAGRARRRRGRSAAFRSRLLDEGYRAVDPLARRRYDVQEGPRRDRLSRRATPPRFPPSQAPPPVTAAKTEEAPRPAPSRKPPPAPAAAKPSAAPKRRDERRRPLCRWRPPTARSPRAAGDRSHGDQVGRPGKNGGADATIRTEAIHIPPSTPELEGPIPPNAGHFQARARSDRAPAAHVPRVRLHRRARRRRDARRAAPPLAARSGPRLDRERAMPREVREHSAVFDVVFQGALRSPRWRRSRGRTGPGTPWSLSRAARRMPRPTRPAPVAAPAATLTPWRTPQSTAPSASAPPAPFLAAAAAAAAAAPAPAPAFPVPAATPMAPCARRGHFPPRTSRHLPPRRPTRSPPHFRRSRRIHSRPARRAAFRRACQSPPSGPLSRPPGPRTLPSPPVANAALIAAVAPS